jgi:hypothetical protein
MSRRYAMRIVIVLCALSTLSSLAKAQEKAPAAPTKEEVELLLTQTERGMDQYASLIQQADKLLAGIPDADLASDKKLIGYWKDIDKLFRAHPDKFDSRAGFDLLVMIDDASRNAALIGTSAAKQTSQEIIAGRIQHADLFVTLMQNASSTSTLLFTVSENCNALYLRYLGFIEAFVGKALDVMDKCSDKRK